MSAIQKPTLLEALDEILRDQIDESAFEKNGSKLGEGQVAKNLNTIIKTINGLENYTASTSGWGEEVTLTSAVKGEADIILSLNQTTQSLINALIGAAKGNIPKEDIPLIVQGKFN